MVTVFSPDSVTRTLPPGVSPIVFRILTGITTWPLAEVLTIGIFVHLFPQTLNISKQSITCDKEGVKNDPAAKDRLPAQPVHWSVIASDLEIADRPRGKLIEYDVY